jgi:hypothetical protein
MLDQTGARAVAYQVLDRVLADESVSAGTRGAMFAVVDSLRASDAPIEHVRRAENISVGMHKLEWALQQRDSAATRAALDELRSLAAGWLNMRICSRT